jgi:hypothetical protein
VALPSLPITGDYIQITDGNDFSINNLLILRNGSTIDNIVDDILLTIPGCTYEFIYDGITWQVTATTGAQGPTGPGLSSRTNLIATANSLPNNTTANLDVVGFSGYVLYQVETSHACWVRIYVNNTARTNDASRPQNQDPLPGSGVVSEVITSGNEVVIISPGVIGFNAETTTTNIIPISITNISGSTANISVTLTVLQIEE